MTFHHVLHLSVMFLSFLQKDLRISSFVVVVNGAFFELHLLVGSGLYKTIDFYIVTLLPATLLNSLIPVFF